MGPVTHYDYDRLSRRTQIVAPDPDGAGGNLLSPVTTYEYDGLSRVTRMEEPDPDAVVGNAGPLTRPVTTYEYDAASQLLRETDPLLRTVDYDYDYLGRTTTVTRQAGDPLQQVTAYQFDAVGNLLAMTEPDPDGAGDLASPVTRYAYDRLDRRIEIVDPREGRTAFTFDAVGNLARLTDPVGNATFFTYDRLDRQTAETVHLSSTPGATAGLSSSARTYEYDAAGGLTQKTDRLGRVTKYAYDALGRRLTEDWFADAADPATDRTLNFTYDVAGQLTAASDPAAAYDFDYDYLGRTTKLTHDLAGLNFDVVFDQLFDDLGRRTELGAKINQWNDFLNKYTYDGLSRLTRVTQEGQGPEFPVADKRVDFTYNAIGQFTSITRYGDLAGTSVVAVSDYQYDTLARLTDIDHDKADQTLIAGYGYTFDALNRITGIDFKNPAHDAEDVAFAYDATDQLITADRAGTTEDESYVHDLNGNRAFDGYETESHNRMSSDGTYDYTYDAEGNRTAKFIDGDLSGHVSAGDTDVTLYEWDHRNRLVKVTTQATQGTNDKIVEYEYDVFNNRVAKHIDTDANGASDRDEFYVYDLDDPEELADVVLDFVDADGAGATASPDLTTRYLHGNAVDQLLAQEDATGTGSSADITWPLADHLGTIRDLVDSTGALVTGGHLTYDSFGNLTGGDQSLTRYQFTGREYDADAQLRYYRARWYDPATGRWISEDPIGFAGGDANLSRYVGNAVTVLVDPSGLSVIIKIGRKTINEIREVVAEKGLRGLVQIHHVLMENLFKKGKYKDWLIGLGLKADDPCNLIVLPTIKGKVDRGFRQSVHQGRHAKRYVDDVIRKGLGEIREKWEENVAKYGKDKADAMALADIAKFKDKVKEGLENGEIALHNYEVLEDGQIVSLGGLFLVAAGDIRISAEEFYSLRTYAGDNVVLISAASLVDLINPLADVGFLCDTIELTLRPVGDAGKNVLDNHAGNIRARKWRVLHDMDIAPPRETPDIPKPPEKDDESSLPWYTGGGWPWNWVHDWRPWKWF